MNLFERLARGRPAPVEKAQAPAPAQLLLDWLQCWNKNVITTRQIRVFGPKRLRDRESAISAIETLTKRGWLRPIQARQRNYRLWQIVRKVHPSVAA